MPRVHVDVVDVQPAGDLWRTTWLVGNDGDCDLTLTGARTPHGRYRAEPRALDLRLAGDEANAIELDVRADVDGGEIENAFLILTLRSAGGEWRILARLRVRIDGGVPWPFVERIDLQEVGFSGSG